MELKGIEFDNNFAGLGYLPNGIFKLQVYVPFANESMSMAYLPSNKINSVLNFSMLVLCMNWILIMINVILVS